MLAEASVFAVDGDTMTFSNDSDDVLATFTRRLIRHTPAALEADAVPDQRDDRRPMTVIR